MAEKLYGLTVTLPNPSHRGRGYNVLPLPDLKEGWGEGAFQKKLLVTKAYDSKTTYFVIPAKAGIQKQCENTGFRVKPGMTDRLIYEALLMTVLVTVHIGLTCPEL